MNSPCATCPFAHPEAYAELARKYRFGATAEELQASPWSFQCHATSYDFELRRMRPEGERTPCIGQAQAREAGK